MDENENNRNSIGSGGTSTDGRRLSLQRPHFYYNVNRGRLPTPAEEERFRICVTLIITWIFMIVSALFLVCYVYVLEWTPETTDPIHVFSLDVAVNMLYFMFVIDICAAIAVIVSQKEFMTPFNYRIFWPAVGLLCLNQLHGTLIWLWVWTGEFPRTCARNTFYFGRQCANIQMIMVADPNTDGKLSLSDCKCDYGQCLPECKGLRLIQNYFWGTYWLYALRLACLVMFIPPLRKAVCECKWCCCATAGVEGRSRRVSHSPLLPLNIAPIPHGNDNGRNSCRCNHNEYHSDSNETERRSRRASGDDNGNVCSHCCQSVPPVTPQTCPILERSVAQTVIKEKASIPATRKVSQGTGESMYAFCKRNNDGK